MIAADHIKFSDDGTEAWWVPDTSTLGEVGGDMLRTLDRPCAGTASNPVHYRRDCKGCHGSGRHCFDIEIKTGWRDYDPYIERLTVSVVEGMVLQIHHNDNAPMLDGARFVEMWDDMRAVAWIDGDNAGVFTLPSAAAPGMFAVKLRVAS